MTELVNEQCQACRAGAPQLDAHQLAELRQSIPEWQLVEVHGEQRLKRVFKHANFAEALAFANRVGELAEQHNHHPAITIEWGKTTVEWWTHKIGGLHRNDVVMAAKTDSSVAA